MNESHGMKTMVVEGSRRERMRSFARVFTRLAGEAPKLAVLTAMSILAACGDRGEAVTADREGSGKFGQVDAQRLRAADQDAGNWFTTGRSFHEEHYSPLAQINEDNVGSLGFAWAYKTGTRRGLEATPVVVDGVLYTSGNFGAVYALDARNGRAIWTYDPQVPGSVARTACCDAVNRGVAVWEGKVFVGTLDGRLVALDAASGKLVWQADNIIDHESGYTSTGAPRVAGRVVVIGNAGGDRGVRGYISAYDVDSGKLEWRFFTVPGDPKQPIEHPELAMAVKTWDPESRWEAGGGGTVWDAMAYDPELDLLYVGTGNSAPYPAWLRSPKGGDNLFLASILAIRPSTGRLVWHYQTTPGEMWDYTATQNIILATLEIEGAPRRVLMQAPKNGFFYVLDRATGELISAEKFVRVNWASHVDLKSGRPVLLPDADYRDGEKMVYPSWAGGHNWPPMAFHPGTQLVYIPSRDVGMNFKAVERFEFDARRLNDGLDHGAMRYTPSQAALLAWDPREQRAVWRVDYPFVRNGGLLASAGNLVFQGTADGRLTAYRANTGERLLALDTGASIMAAPATYAIDGTQYVVVMAGYGGAGLAHFPEGSAARRYGNDGQIIAFKLGGGPVPLPPQIDWDADLPPLPPRPRKLDTAQRQRAEQMFLDYCSECHGLEDEPAGYPNLLRLHPAKHRIFQEIVLGGAFAAGGMASFADALTEQDAQLLHDYLIETAYEVRARKGLPVQVKATPAGILE